MLQLESLTYRIGARVLFEGANLAISAGWRVGLAGRNGTGKTTILKLIARELQPDSGEIKLQPRASVGRLSQEAPGGPASLLDTVLSADVERSRLLEELDQDPAPERLAEIHDRLRAIGSESAPARAARILAGLGFDEEAQQRPCQSFSGGWRMRVALASLLFSQPDLLLLDEPTNHLDLEAALWLEGFLASYPGTLILVSHDRALLNKVPTRIAHLEGGKLRLYNGNYDTFEKTRREQLELQAAANAKLETQRKHIQSFVDRFRYKASKARQAQSRLKMLEKLQPLSALAEEAGQSFNLDFPNPEPLAPPIIQCDEAEVGYDPEKPILKQINLRIDMDDRIALLGANGNGKTTLARLISGRLSASAGKLQRSPKLRVAYFAQDQADELNLKASGLDLMAQRLPQAKPEEWRKHLGRFGFSGNRAETPIGSLSGGEKARLLFALMTLEKPHLLILDEPTNHLDIDTRESLVQALNVFEGAVILISHDSHLVELVADRLWLVQEGAVTRYEGDMEDYRKLLLEQRREERRRASAETRNQEDSVGISKKDKRKEAAEKRAALAPLRKAAQAAEREVGELSKKIALIESALADPELYEKDPDKLIRLQKDHADLTSDRESAEERWLEAAGALEEAGL